MRRVAELAVPPLVLFAVVLAAWEGAVWWWDLKPYLLPRPLVVLEAARREAMPLAKGTLLTGAEAVCGFGLSVAGGTLIGFLFSQSRTIRTAGYPYAIFLQTVPIIAIAPLIVTWFGTGFHSVVLVAFVVSLFPMITSATTGMTELDPDQVDFFRLYGATRWQVTWKLRLPSAVPHLVTGAKTSAGVAVIGAIVGEFFTGAQRGLSGLGYLIQYKAKQLQTDELFATVFCCTLLGVGIFGAVNAVGAGVLRRWSEG